MYILYILYILHIMNNMFIVCNMYMYIQYKIKRQKTKWGIVN